MAPVNQKWLDVTPEGIKKEDVAAIALVGITAHIGVVMRAKARPHETVVVNGALEGWAQW